MVGLVPFATFGVGGLCDRFVLGKKKKEKFPRDKKKRLDKPLHKCVEYGD